MGKKKKKKSSDKAIVIANLITAILNAIITMINLNSNHAQMIQGEVQTSLHKPIFKIKNEDLGYCYVGRVVGDINRKHCDFG